MKEVKIKKGLLKKIGIITTSIFLLFLFIWLGISFYLMSRDAGYVAMFIDLSDNTLASKVKNDFPTREGKFLKYLFPVTVEQYSDSNDRIEISGVPLNYRNYYETKDEARFEYSLDKDKGNYDFSEIEWNDTILVTLQYRLDKDFRYYFEFSTCVLKRAYFNLFNIDNECSRGNCYVERDLNMWFVEEEKKDVALKSTFLQSFDKDKLIRLLTNFYITDDFGYYKTNNGFKAYSVQVASPDRTYQYEATRVNEENLSTQMVSVTPWVLNGVSRVYGKNYQEYNDIDLVGYLKEITSYLQYNTVNSYNSCQLSYDVVSNLSECKTDICSEIKDSVYNYCKTEVEREISTYQRDSENYYGYFYYGKNTGAQNSYLLSLPSELIYYNKIVDSLGINAEKYDKKTIERYSQNAESMIGSEPELIEKCYLIKNLEDLNKEYGDLGAVSKVATIVSTLPDFNSVCDGNVKDDYCTLTITEKLVCADALLSNNPNTSQVIIQDIFYRHYFTSPSAFQMFSYENYRTEMAPSKSDGIKLEEYGYFVNRQESLTDNGEVVVASFANLTDSYYFIYLLDKLNYEN